MAYSDLQDLLKYMPRKVIEQLTDDDNIGDINEEIVDDIISQSDNLIDSFCRGRYPVEMDDADVPDMINDLSVKLTAYKLYARRLITTLPETIAKDYQYCMTQLKAIQSGKLSPWPVASNPVVFVTNKTSTDKIYNSTVLDTYYDGLN